MKGEIGRVESQYRIDFLISDPFTWLSHISIPYEQILISRMFKIGHLVLKPLVSHMSIFQFCTSVQQQTLYNVLCLRWGWVWIHLLSLSCCVKPQEFGVNGPNGCWHQIGGQSPFAQIVLIAICQTVSSLQTNMLPLLSKQCVVCCVFSLAGLLFLQYGNIQLSGISNSYSFHMET